MNGVGGTREGSTYTDSSQPTEECNSSTDNKVHNVASKSLSAGDNQGSGETNKKRKVEYSGKDLNKNETEECSELSMHKELVKGHKEGSKQLILDLYSKQPISDQNSRNLIFRLYLGQFTARLLGDNPCSVEPLLNELQNDLEETFKKTPEEVSKIVSGLVNKELGAKEVSSLLKGRYGENWALSCFSWAFGSTPSMCIPLHFAIAFVDLNLVKLLLEKGSGVNKVDQEGWTPLHVACGDALSNKTKHPIIKLLLDHRANCDVEGGRDSRLPIDVLLSHNDSEHEQCHKPNLPLLCKLQPLKWNDGSTIDFIRRLLGIKKEGCWDFVSILKEVNCTMPTIPPNKENEYFYFMIVEGVIEALSHLDKEALEFFLDKILPKINDIGCKGSNMNSNINSDYNSDNNDIDPYYTNMLNEMFNLLCYTCIYDKDEESFMKECMNLFLQKGVNLNHKVRGTGQNLSDIEKQMYPINIGPEQYPLLTAACDLNTPPIKLTTILGHKGVNVNIKNDEDETVLMVRAKYMVKEMFEQRTIYGRLKERIDDYKRIGWWIKGIYNIDRYAELIKAGVDPDALDEDGKRFIDYLDESVKICVEKHKMNATDIVGTKEDRDKFLGGYRKIASEFRFMISKYLVSRFRGPDSKNLD